jgi:hypothetical protein
MESNSCTYFIIRKNRHLVYSGENKENKSNQNAEYQGWDREIL